MAQEKFEKDLDNNWVALSDIISVDSSKTYYIQNRGYDCLVACEGASEPDNTDGIMVQPYCVVKYKEGSQELYLRSFATKCSVNISSEE